MKQCYTSNVDINSMIHTQYNQRQVCDVVSRARLDCILCFMFLTVDPSNSRSVQPKPLLMESAGNISVGHSKSSKRSRNSEASQQDCNGGEKPNKRPRAAREANCGVKVSWHFFHHVWFLVGGKFLFRAYRSSDCFFANYPLGVGACMFQ
jgi:hypothetical protein